jgi:hypothetical protein
MIIDNHPKHRFLYALSSVCWAKYAAHRVPAGPWGRAAELLDTIANFVPHTEYHHMPKPDPPPWPIYAQELHELSTMINAHGLTATLFGIVRICRDKAHELRQRWKDGPAADQWDKLADTLNRAARKAQREGI